MESAELDIDAINAQAEAGNEANADYQVGSPVAAVPPPQLPDTALLQEQRAGIQGGDRPTPGSESVAGDDVKILDDGTRLGVDPETGEETGRPAEPDEGDQPAEGDQPPAEGEPAADPASQPAEGEPAPSEPAPKSTAKKR